MQVKQATEPDRSFHELKVKSDNHVADTRDDRVGGSHVDCSGHGGEMQQVKEHWMLSCLFRWLKAAGWNIKDAYRVVEEYVGKRSYDQLDLAPPEPMSQECGYTREWSHMSDYDETGCAPSSIDERGLERPEVRSEYSDEQNRVHPNTTTPA